MTKDRIKTLLLYSNGAYWQAVAVDTALRGFLGLRDGQELPGVLARWPRLRGALKRRYETMSYMQDWQDAFSEAPELDVELCNISNLVEYASYRRAIKHYPLIVVLHSAAGDNMSLLLKTASWFQERRGTLLVLIGNEYDLMPAKIGFLRTVGANYVGSQLPLDAARWLYAGCDHTEVLAAPHALNPRLYYPEPHVARTTDIGFVGNYYPYFIGDIERTAMIRYFQDHETELGLTCDIRSERLARSAWAAFLNRCKGIIGAESGTYYLERTDQTKSAVQAYLATHPDASFETIYDRIFKDYPAPVSGKAISSRHFEPIGTQTCQILLEGRYNDILVADEHYIALKRDLSNVRDAIERFKDESYRTAMVTRTYEFVRAEHTYQRRVRSLLNMIFAGDTSHSRVDTALGPVGATV